MEKLWLIIKREYLTRVKKRSFILGTILTPLAFAFFMVVVGFIFSYEGGEKLRIAVIDKGSFLDGKDLPADKSIYFIKSKKSLETLKENVLTEDKYNGILVIPEMKNMSSKDHTIYYYAEEQLSLDIAMKIENKVEKVLRDFKIQALQLDKKQLQALNTKVSLDPEPINEDEEDASTITGMIGGAIGGAMGFIMYFVVFIYGMMVMRSVMEEKMNRIVEVMISSVKPFQLMMGKIIGVGAVGLTQVAIWAILIPIMYFLVFLFFGFDTSQLESASSMNASQIDPDDIEAIVQQVMVELGKQNWWMIAPLFVFYFLGGYFLYASLFAAVGSAMGDDLGEGQALTIPITIPVVLALYIMIVAVRSPNSNLAIWSSIFPLFSPIVMPARLAFSPPLWQVALSILVLIVTVIFFVWLSARIYRVGILMYGKKVSFKEIGKWIFYTE